MTHSGLSFIDLLGESIYAAAGMLWLIFWALVLGFALSGAVQAFVSKKKITGLLGKPGMRELGIAAFFGAASSSCSYAAASMSRSLFQRGAHIIPSLAFLLASTNLVLELSIVLWVLMGWQFVLAEFVGGIIMILMMALLMRFFGPLEAFREKQRELSKVGVKGEDDGADGNGWARMAQAFMMEGRMIGKDVVLGVLISGFLMVLVPDTFWQSLFLSSGGGSGTQAGALKLIENAFAGPLVSMLSFVCSVGNIPLASVLFRGGISFGGAISFIYADLIIIPLILIYRKYYGWKLALWITGIFYVSMALTGILVDLLFTALGLVPFAETVRLQRHSMQFFQVNYTFWLNLVFAGIALALFLISRSAGKQAAEHHCCH